MFGKIEDRVAIITGPVRASVPESREYLLQPARK